MAYRTHGETRQRIPLMFKPFYFGLVLICSSLAGNAIAQGQAPPKELVEYVRDAKKAGLKDDQIQQNAVQAGWTAAAVQQAMGIEPTAQPKAKAKEEESKTPAAAPIAPALEQPATAPAPQRPASEPAGTQTPGTQAVTPGGSDSATPQRPLQRNTPDEYRIGEGDVIQINVWGERDASVGSVVVRPDGMITMPLLKDIRVAGLTPAEAEKAIAEPLSKLIKAADVTVIVNQINSKKVFLVGGGIKKEGPLPYTYRMTVMQAISEAGGLTDYAKRKKIYVLRNENGRQFKLPFNYDAVLNGEHMELNIPLLPGDSLVVPNH